MLTPNISSPFINISEELSTYRNSLNQNLQYFHNLKPQENTLTGNKTSTSNIYDLQFGPIQTNEKTMNREDIAEALVKRNILRQVKTIQTSSNIKFVSIESDTPTTVETFCLELLSLKDNFLATFIPFFQTKQKV